MKKSQIIFGYVFKKVIRNPKISMYPITLKCKVDEYKNGYAFEIFDDETNYLITHELDYLFNSLEELENYVHNGFQNYEFDLQQKVKENQPKS